MDINIDIKRDSSDSTSVIIDGEMTINTANEIKKSFSENIKQSSELNIDLSLVNKIDTAGFQLLLAAKQESNKQKIPFKFTNPSQVVEHIFNLYGESN